MATILGSLLVSLGLESAQFRKGMTDAERQMKVTQQKFDKIGSQMAGVGKSLSLAVAAPLAAFGGLSFKAASDAQELQSAFNVTFGGMTDTMNKWAEESGNAMGRSTQSMQEAANKFGTLLTNVFPEAEAASMSQELAALSVDLGSFFNMADSDALQKLRSGLAGESEPLKDFGILMNEAAVKAKALEMGLGGAGRELTEQEKIQARYKLILEATTKAQGDAIRTADSTANQMKRAEAAFQELSIAVGTKLLPILTPLIEKIASALEWFTKLPAPVQNTVLVIGGLGAALGPVLYVFGNLTSAFGILLPLLVKLGPAFTVVRTAALALMTAPPILAFAAVVTGIYLAWQNWDKIKPYIDRVGAAISAFWTRNIKPAFDAIRSAVAGIGNLIGKMVQIGRDMIAGLVNGIKANAAAVWATLKNVVLSGIDNVKAFLGIKSPSRVFMGIGRDIGAGLAIGIDSTREAVASSMVGLGEGLQEFRKQSEITTVRVAKSFKDMADETLSSLRGLADSIKSGGFLDIFESVVGLFLQVGSTGLFGQKLAANINKTVDGARAMGGPVRAGGSYLVGERGPEIFSPSRSGQIIPNGSFGGGVTRIQVDASPYFDVRVDGRATAVAAPMAMQAAGAGSAGAQMSLARSRKRSMA